MTEFNRKQLQARNPLRMFLDRPLACRLFAAVEGLQPVYPEVPAGWPSRATRRAVKQNRFQRLSGEWRQVLVNHPALVPHIKAL